MLRNSKGECIMLKRFSLMSLIAAAFALSVACAHKKPVEAPTSGTEGKMDASVTGQNIAFDPAGSDSGKITGLSSVHFDYDSSTLSSDARRQLSENADWIKGHASATVQVEGHCDSRGSVEYNLALGERRAKAVKNYLVSLGVDSKHLTIISYGEEKPIDPAQTDEAFAKNRRANFVPLAQ
jgi:peptidoglycan-associated lipoprotein